MIANVTWKCHVCGDERPDQFISVHKKPFRIGTTLAGEQNIRFCNDRDECRLGACKISFVNGATMADVYIGNKEDKVEPAGMVRVSQNRYVTSDKIVGKFDLMINGDRYMRAHLAIMGAIVAMLFGGFLVFIGLNIGRGVLDRLSMIL